MKNMNSCVLIMTWVIYLALLLLKQNYIIKNCKIGINVASADDTINWSVIV